MAAVFGKNINEINSCLIEQGCYFQPILFPFALSGIRIHYYEPLHLGFFLLKHLI
jgi:hypothetical protein